MSRRSKGEDGVKYLLRGVTFNFHSLSDLGRIVPESPE